MKNIISFRKDKEEIPVDLEKRKHKILQISSIFVILIIWEIFANILKLITPQHASLIWPSFEDIFLNSLPYLGVFYGMGGLGTGTYGQGPSYSYAFIVIGYHTALSFMRILAGFLLLISFHLILSIFFHYQYDHSRV